MRACVCVVVEVDEEIEQVEVYDEKAGEEEGKGSREGRKARDKGKESTRNSHQQPKK